MWDVCWSCWLSHRKRFAFNCSNSNSRSSRCSGMSNATTQWSRKQFVCANRFALTIIVWYREILKAYNANARSNGGSQTLFASNHASFGFRILAHVLRKSWHALHSSAMNSSPEAPCRNRSAQSWKYNAPLYFFKSVISKGHVQ